MLASTAVQAALIQPVYGQVLINQGQGYKAVSDPIQLRQGDTIIVNPGGTANLTYPDGCTVQVTPGSVITVGAQSPCALQGQQGQLAQPQTPPSPQGPGPVETAAAAGTSGGTGTLVAIGLGIAVAGGLAFALVGSGDDNKPASP